MAENSNILPNYYCFVAMPFDIALKNVWDLAICPAIESVGLTAWRGDTASLGANIIIQDITKSIYHSEIVIADLTGLNANVMYELGLMHAAKKNTIIIAQNEADIPFNLSHIRYLLYDVRDLKSLQIALSARINTAIGMKDDERSDHFPELGVLDDKSKVEYEYLKSKAMLFEIRATPPTADIFFNDRLLGTSPQTIKMNPDAIRNTVSVAAIAHFEHHQDLSHEDLSSGFIQIDLDKTDYSVFEARVPGWLRFRRRDPHNPVLMRAIAQYLLHIGQRDEAYKELQEVLEIAPEWYMAHNQIGFTLQNEPEKALPHYRRAISLNPDNYVGYYNKACAHARLQQYDLALSALCDIASVPAALASFRYRTYKDLVDDPVFEELMRDEVWGQQLKTLSDKLNAHVAQ